VETSTNDATGSIAPPDLHAWRELGLLVRALEDDRRRLHARVTCATVRA